LSASSRGLYLAVQRAVGKSGSADFENVRRRFAALHFPVRRTGDHVMEHVELVLQMARLRPVSRLRTARRHGHRYAVSAEMFQQRHDSCTAGAQVG